MPDPRTGASLAAGLDDLRRAAAAAAGGVSGVVRLEPSLADALHRLRTDAIARATGHQDPHSTAGVRLTRHAGTNTVDVHVDLTTAPTAPAARTAREVQAALREAIAARDLTPGQVTVTVLRLLS